MANIFSLYGSIYIDNEKANKSIDETTKKGKKSSSSFVENFTKISKKTFEIGTAVVGATTAIVGGLTAAANGTASVADEIDKGSIRMGIGTKAFQELKYAAGQCGVEMSVMEKAAKKLEGTDLNMESAMNQIMELATAEERSAKAAELFGETVAYNLSPLIEQSSESYDGLIDNANKLGLIMSEDAVSAGVLFGDTMSDIQQSLGAVGNNLMSAIIPIIQRVLELILQNMPMIQSMINTLAPVLINMLNTILPIFVDFVSMIFPLLMDLMNQLLPPLTEIIQGLLPIFTEILGAILPPLIDIVEILLPPLMEILNALLPLIMPIIDILSELINVALNPIIKTVSSIINIISKTLTATLKGLTPVVKGVKEIFKDVFGGLFNIVKAPINAIIDGINVFIKALNKIQVPDWVPAIGGKGINLPLIKKLRVGIENVPYDEMPALLHKGETVLTKEEADIYRNNKTQKEQNIVNNYNNTIIVEHLETKDENDINRIAEQLYYLQKRGEV